MTQVRLSIELGITQETVSSYENERCYPSYETLLKLANLFHVSLDYLMGLVPPIESDNSYAQQKELLLELFQRLNQGKREKAIAYLQGLCED